MFDRFYLFSTLTHTPILKHQQARKTLETQNQHGTSTYSERGVASCSATRRGGCVRSVDFYWPRAWTALRSVSMDPVMNFLVLFLTRPKYIRSPHLRAKFGELLFSVFLPNENQSKNPLSKPSVQCGLLLSSHHLACTFSIFSLSLSTQSLRTQYKHQQANILHPD